MATVASVYRCHHCERVYGAPKDIGRSVMGWS